MHYKVLNSTKLNSWADFGNYLIIGSNKLASDFGQNIWKPLLGLFLVHLLLYNLFIFFNYDAYFNPKDCDLILTKVMMNNYFITIIPTHNIVIDGKNIGGFWDFMMRVFAGYFIFYFITASRKYHQ